MADKGFKRERAFKKGKPDSCGYRVFASAMHRITFCGCTPPDKGLKSVNPELRTSVILSFDSFSLSHIGNERRNVFL